MATSPPTGQQRTPGSIEEVVRDAGWLAHRYDPGHDAFHFRPVSRAAHRSATFLTDENLPAGAQPLPIARADVRRIAAAQAPLHFMFHSAYCCSTLLARAFDRPGWAMGLKEPVVLNDLIGWRRRGGAGPDQADVLNDALGLLARPFGRGEAVVVKPSTAINALAPAMLTLRPASKALLLHAPLPTYVASIAKKGLEGRLWVRTLLLGMIDDRMPTFGFGPREHLALTDLQIAAIGWLGQQAFFAEAVRQFGPGRVRTLDSGTLMRRQRDAMAALAALFGIDDDDTTIDQVIAGPAFTRHSKLGTAFDADARATENQSAADLHADEIGKVLAWAERLADAAGVPLTLPAPLLA